MNRPSKKEIKAALEKLKNPSPSSSSAEHSEQAQPAKLEAKKSSIRIRKQGI